MNTPSLESSQINSILLVEDNDGYRQIVAASLAKALPECRIVEADSVAMARTVVPVESLKVALLDMTLPDGMATDIMEGWQPAIGEGLKVVVFSSYDAEEVAPALQRFGVHAYVNKERGMRALVQAVQTAVQSVPKGKDVQTGRSGPNLAADGVGH